jgi:hypothetical protein
MFQNAPLTDTDPQKVENISQPLVAYLHSDSSLVIEEMQMKIEI